MSLSKEMQYALALTAYVTRAGRARVLDAAANLNYSHSFLAQIARKLAIAGVFKSIRGPAGGYEVIGTPTVKDVLRVFDYVLFMEREDADASQVGPIDTRILASLNAISIRLNSPMLNLTIKQLLEQTVALEVYVCNAVTEKGSIQ